MRKRWIAGLFAIFGLMLSVEAATSASATTPEFRLSLKADGIRASAGEESLRYSSLWDGGSNETAKVTLKQGDAVLSENLTDEGDYAWSATTNGTYNLTHTTYTNGAVAKVLNATFVVSGLPDPFPEGSVTVTGYNGKFDGNGHSISVTTTGIANPTITYSRTAAGPFEAANPSFTNVCDETVWCVIVADGYITQTNSAKIVITQGDIGPGGGVEPGTGEIPEGGLSKFDATYVYDGEGHTINTQALFAVTLAGATPSFSFSNDVAKIWENNAPSYTNAGKYVVWYRISAPNYNDYIHAAYVTITNKPVRVKSAEAHQRYPWNGLVDIDVTFDGELDDLAQVECTFAATNSATEGELPITYISRTGTDIGSGRAWKRRYVWNAAADVGETEISNVVVSVGGMLKGLGVQLWENGPYWAESNVGAESPEDSGYYFWWGDVVGYAREGGTWLSGGSYYAGVTWVSSAGKRMSDSPFNPLTCPTRDANSERLRTLGYVDSTGNLVLAHDAAAIHLGGPWKMPSLEDISKLDSKCTSSWEKRNGVYGRRVKGKGLYSSKSIFIPAVGYGSMDSILAVGTQGHIWSSTLWTSDTSSAYCSWYFAGSSTATGNYYDSYRNYGRSVRAIRSVDSEIISAVIIENTVVVTPGFRLSVNDGVRASASSETLRYSTLWDGGTNETASVTLSQDDVTLTENLAGEGDYNWSVVKPGLYTLTHSTYTNGAVAKTLTAQFQVVGVPVDPADITVTPYDAAYDGAAHGISVVGPEGTTVKYCATSNGTYAAEATFKDVCTTQIWYEVSGGGYLAYTNSAALKITPRPVTLTSGTKTDFVYDGQPHEFPVLIKSESWFVAGEGVATSNWATVTTVDEGKVPNAFDYAPITGTKLSNYDISVVTGKVAVVKGSVDPSDDPGKPDPSVDPSDPEQVKDPAVKFSPWDYVGMYDGIEHTFGTNDMAAAYAGKFGSNAPSFSYATTSNGIYVADAFVFKNVIATSFWYKVSAANYDAIIHPCKVIITNRPVTVTSGTKTDFVYDGRPHAYTNLMVTSGSFVAGEGIATSNWATVTTIAEGQVDNAFDYEPIGDTKLSNYDISVVTGKIAVASPGTVVVTITGHVSNVVYDGTLKSVSGYDVVSISDSLYKSTDFKFTGNASTNGTDAGTYPMGLKTSDFVNTNGNFSAVTFNVTDGGLTIAQATNVWTTVPTIEGWTYGEAAKTPVGAAKFGIVDFTYSPTPVGAAGDYTMTASVAAAGNYSGLSTNVNFTIAAKPIVPGGEDDPEKPDPSKPLPPGAVSKYDFVGMYDGALHTIDTNELTQFTYQHATALTFSYALTEKGAYQPEPFAFKDVVTTSFWYRIKAANYSNYYHEAKVTITNRPVTVTSGTKIDFTYDGQPHAYTNLSVTTGSFVTGEGIVTSNWATVTTVADGQVDNAFDYAPLAGTKLENYDISVVTGKIAVVSPGAVTVTITGRVNQVTYDGTEKSVSGYDIVSISDPLYKATDFKFTGTASTNATDAGTYPMGLANSQFVNTNDNFAAVTFVVTDGWLEIAKASVDPSDDPGKVDPSVDPSDPEQVKDPTIKFSPWDYVGMYDGAEHTFGTNDMAAAYAGKFGSNAPSFSYATTSNGTYVAEAFVFKDVVATSFWYKVSAANYDDIVHPCKVIITNRPVTVTSGTKLDFAYDGNPHAYTNLMVTAGSFVTGEGIATSNWATVTTVAEGQVDNAFDYAPLVGTKLSNYDFAIVTGKIAIAQVGAVTVTITGRVNHVTYDGTEKSVGGYDIVSISDPLYKATDFKFTGTALTNATDAGTYPMGLANSQFVNTNDNFAAVTFVVTDGWLEIAKASVDPSDDPGKPDPSVDPTDPEQVKDPTIKFSPWDCVGIYDGAEHTVDTNAMKLAYADKFGSNAPSFSYATTSNGTYIAEAFVFKDVVATSFWYKVSAANYDDIVHPCKVIITNRPVTMTSGTKLDFAYDGNPHAYTNLMVTAGSFVTGEGIATSNWATVTAVAEGQVDNAFDYTPIEGTKLSNYDFSVVTGKIAIAQVGAVTVTITGRVSSVVYDGTEKSVSGYDLVSISDPLYKATDFKFTGTASTNATDAGTYPMGLANSQFVNTNDNFAAVTFVVTDGWLEIAKASVDPSDDPGKPDPSVDPSDPEQVKDPTIKFSPWDYVGMYDGSEHTFGTNEMAAAYADKFGSNAPSFSYATTSNGMYIADAFVFKDVVETSFWYKVSASNYDDIIHPCKVIITNRPVTVTSGTKLEFVYDGNPHAYTNLMVTAGSFVTGEGIATSNWATVTAVAEGQVDNAFDYTPIEGTKLSNYDFSVVTGKIAIAQVGAVTVTITGRVSSVVYDGTEKSVSGYDLVSISDPLYKETDFRFDGHASTNATDAGTYPMGLANSQFVNTNDNFAAVTFVVTDGWLEIKKASVDPSDDPGKPDPSVDPSDPEQVKDPTIKFSPWDYVGMYDGVEHTFGTNDMAAAYAGKFGSNAPVFSYAATSNGTYIADAFVFKDVIATSFWYKVSAANYDDIVHPCKVIITNRPVIVTSGTKLDFVYDGQPHAYTNLMVTAGSFVTGEGIATSNWATVTTVAEGQVPNTFDYAPIEGTKLSNYDFSVVTGKIAIAQVGAVTVTITGRVNSVVYDGTQKSVSGYDVVSISDPLYKETDFRFDGHASTNATDAGTYPMGLANSQFVNTNDNFAAVTFVVTDGWLEIAKASVDPSDDPGKPDPSVDPSDPDQVKDPTIKFSPWDYVGMYDGAEHTFGTNDMAAAYAGKFGSNAPVFSYAATSNGTYIADAFVFKDVIATSFWYKVSAANYDDIIHPCKVIITNRPVTVTSGTKLDFVYDGNPHAYTNLVITSGSFVTGEGIATSNWATVTTVAEGQVDNAFDYAPMAGTKMSNYDFSVMTGKIAVVDVPPPTTTVKVAFDALGGKIGIRSVVTQEMDSVYSSLPTAVRENYLFQGWFLGVTNGAPQATDGAALLKASDHALFAKWVVDPDVCDPSIFKWEAIDANTARIIGFVNPNQQIAKMVIPEMIGGRFVTEIAALAFSSVKCGATEVSFPAYLTKIGDRAFMSIKTTANAYSLKKITFVPVRRWEDPTKAGSLTIGAYAFSSETPLESLTLPAEVTSIGNYAFANCRQMASITILGKPTIGTMIFRNAGVDVGGVTVHIDPALAGDADYMAQIKGGLGNVTVKTDAVVTGIETSGLSMGSPGKVTLTLGVARAASWGKVDTSALKVEYRPTLDSTPTSLTPVSTENSDGTVTVEVQVPQGSSGFLRVGIQ